MDRLLLRRRPRRRVHQVRLDEPVEVPVHHRGDVAHFLAGAVVLDHLVGLEDVRADLAAPADFLLLAGEKKEIGWGSQIRSYVFQPYQMVKDHRTGKEVGNVSAVMDGDLDGFIEAYLMQTAAGAAAKK